jgi:predicted enzyme related to lactoylglutathione lyase
MDSGGQADNGDQAGAGARLIRAVMFFAADPRACCRWWAEHLGGASKTHVEAGGFCWFEVSGVEVGFHPADEDRNPVGGSPVIYWAVDDLERRRSEFLQAGCTAHRGPLDIAAERRICQLRDPFGNIFGLDGP